MSRGQTPDVDTLLSLSVWLGVPLETYAHGEVAAPDSRSQMLESIRSYLRADEASSEESAEAITSVLRAAYDQLAQRQEVVAAEPAPELARGTRSQSRSLSTASMSADIHTSRRKRASRPRASTRNTRRQ
jgi:hypothetical protein